MFKTTTLTAAFIAVASTAGAVALNISGSPLADTFNSFHGGGPGTHGVELRGGDSRGQATWELGIGTATSQPGDFNEANFDWGTEADMFNFDFATGPGTSTFRIWGVGQTPADATIVTYDGLLTGNAFQILAKRKSSIFLSEIDGLGVSAAIGDANADDWVTATFFGDKLSDGFTLVGSVKMAGGGNSRNGLFISAGSVSTPPVSLPAALPLLLAGIGSMAMLRRRIRS